MKKEQFKLKMLEFKKGKVAYKATVTSKIGDVTNTSYLNTSETKLPHPDLEFNFEDFLKKVAIKVMGYTAFIDIIAKGCTLEDEKAAVTALKFRFEKYKEDLLSNVVVNKIEYNGTEDTSGIVLSGKHFILGTGKEIDFKTPSITISNDTNLYGIEEDLQSVAEYIENEAYEYIFEDKVSYEPIDFQDE